VTAEASFDPFAAETSRLVQVLARLVKEKHVSVRSLEKAMGVGDSVFSKVLKGKITLNVRHVLMICTALGIEWKDFFARAYGMSEAPVEAAPPPAPALDDAELEARLIRILNRLGFVPQKAPEERSP
jgi:transcriptional regulator with XRE-family HTH domain